MAKNYPKRNLKQEIEDLGCPHCDVSIPVLYLKKYHDR